MHLEIIKVPSNEKLIFNSFINECAEKFLNVQVL